MLKIGITGQNGFLGSHLFNTLGLYPEHYERVHFQNSFFKDTALLREFVENCDVIVHFAAMNRHEDPQVLYETNVDLVKKLVSALEETHSKAHVIFSSSAQEEKDNLYGKSKKEGRLLLSKWAEKSGGKFTGMLIPNVFGPFGQPNYNSFIATFCYKLTHGELPEIQQDGEVNLIYVGELVDEIINMFTIDQNHCYTVSHTSVFKVSQVLEKLEKYKHLYFDNGEIPNLNSNFDYQLFNTFRSYIDYPSHFPVKFMKHTDERGAFVELIRLGIGGQCSFSTTVPNITRGNHYHTRKIERFSVIKGEALIKLRKINTNEVLEFYLSGDEPAYVDIPIWYTHNIKNIGEEELYTVFWINEPFNPEDSDTYFEGI